LLGGLRNGRLEAAVAKLEADTAVSAAAAETPAAMAYLGAHAEAQAELVPEPVASAAGQTDTAQDMVEAEQRKLPPMAAVANIDTKSVNYERSSEVERSAALPLQNASSYAN
jgi:hypothetical protein